MRGIYEVFKNNIERTINRKFYFIVALITTCLSIIFAIYFTSQLEIKGNIGVIAPFSIEDLGSQHINVTILEEMPPKSALVMNKFDAIVIFDEAGSFEVFTIKSETFKNSIEKAIINPKSLEELMEKNRGIGSNIVGFLIMFILLQGLTFMTFFVEDKEKRILKRSVTTPLSLNSFVAGHGIYSFTLTFLIVFMVLTTLREGFNIDIGFSYGQYAGFLLVITGLSTVFALFMCILVEKHDNAMSLSSSIIILTSILSGSFYEFGKEEGLYNTLTNIFPQKHFLNWVKGIEVGNSISDYLPQLGYIFLLIILLYILGLFVCNKRFKEGFY